MGFRNISARLPVIGVVLAILLVGMSGQAFAEQARRLRTAEDNVPRPADRVFFNYSYFTSVAVEGGLSSGETSGGINNQRDPIGFEKTFLGGDVSFGMRVPIQVLTGAEPAVAFGVKFRSYFGGHGDPNQALMHYSRDWMIMPYAAMPFVFGVPGQPPGGTQFVITPFVGPIFEHGDLSIFDNQGRASVTRNGVGVGFNFDVVFPWREGVRTFIGFGGQISSMQAVDKTIDGFEVRLDDTVEARAVVRGGFTFR